MADDEDLIYVDVVPRLDEGEAEQATTRLRDKLKDGVKGAGKTIGSVIHSELAQELGSAIGPIARDMGVELGKQLGSKAGDLLHEQLSDALKSVGVDFDGVIDKAHELADEFGVDADKVGKLGDAFKDFKAGDTAKGIDDLATALEKVPGPIGEVSQKSKGLLDTFSGLKGNLKETTSGFMDLAGNSGRIAGGLSAIEAAAGPLAGTFAALDALMPGFDQHLNNVMSQLQGKQGFNPKDWINTLVPGTNLFDKAFPGPVSGNSPIPAKPGVPLVPTPGSTPAAPPGYTATPGSLDPFSALMPPGMSPPSGGGLPSLAPPDTGGGIPAHTSSSISGGGTHQATLIDYTTPSLPSIGSPSDIPAAAGGIANLNRVAQALEGTPYNQQLRNDCSGMVSQLAAAAIGLPPQGPGQRFTTVNEGQWLGAHGFAVDQGPAPAGSLQIGWYDHGGGNAGHTAATLPNGLNAESGGSVGSFHVGGSVGANSSQFEHHAYLPMGAPGAGNSGGIGAQPAGFGTPPGMPGIPPSLVAPPTMPNSGGGGSPGPVSQQQMGHGSGIGVTGGGALGMAEQAGVMAAAIGGFGGGGMAAQIGMQEMNLAIQKGGQMAAVAAMAPFETFHLGGGQMGAPSVGGGWYSKIVGGLVGQQTNLPNIAGATQPPKQQPKGEGEGDPLNGGEQQGKGGKPGPTGHQDDPIHVKQAPSPQGPPQGQTTSAMNATGVQSAMTV